MNICTTQIEADLPARISACLREGELQQAQDLAAGIVGSPEALRQWLPKLGREFRKKTQLEPIIELLWDNKDAAMNEMFVVGCFMRLCEKAGLYDRFGPLLRSWIASNSTSDFTFSEMGTLHHFRRLTKEQQRDFADAKYRRWKDRGRENFLGAADQFSVFATVSNPIAKFLFENGCDKTVPWSQWIRALQSSEMLKHIIADARTIRGLNKSNGLPQRHSSRYPYLPDLSELMDLERAKSIFARIDLSKGLLLCTVHDAHILLAKKCLLHCVPERYLLGQHERGRSGNRIPVGDDGNAHVSAFRAVKALRGKNALLMVPDARRRVAQTSEVKILGISIPFADGTPTIAFESGCATSWYTVRREADRFMPVCVPGPSRETKESYATFKERWWSFYAARLEELFTDDPRNITLWHFWPQLFYAAAAPASYSTHDCLDGDISVV